MKTVTYDEKAWQLVPVEPAPEQIAAAAAATWPLATTEDIQSAKVAARLMLASASMNIAPGSSLDSIAAVIATMFPAYRAFIAAAPQPEAKAVPGAKENEDDLAGYVDHARVMDTKRNGGGVSIGSFSERYGRTIPVYFHPAPADVARDAERWRTVRNNTGNGLRVVQWNSGAIEELQVLFPSPVLCDAEADAAMAAQRGEAGRG